MIVFGSRGSELAMTQSRAVAERLAAVTGEPFRIVHIETTGDRVLDRPLDAIGQKGAFTVELEQAQREGRIDAAVHSLKDLPVDDAEGLCIGAVPERADPRDVLVLRPAAAAPPIGELPLCADARVGTSSPRRRYSLQAQRPDLQLADVRGNVPTRAQKVARGDYDATLLAAAGLDRLQLPLGELQRVPLPTALFPPAPGQGALAVQCRRDDARVRALLAKIHDPAAARCVAVERALLLGLGGGCSLPLGALCAGEADGFRLQAALYAPGGAALRCEQLTDAPEALVDRLAAGWRRLMQRPLQGRRLLLPRPDGDGGAMASALRFCGAEVEVAAWTRTEPLDVARDLALQLLHAEAIAVTSARAVQRLFALAASLRQPWRPAARWFAVGEATAQALRRHGVEPLVADGSGGASLAQLVARELPAGGRVVFPCALGRHGAFEHGCTAAGLDVVAVPLYRTVVVDVVPPEQRPDACVLTSPSATFGFVQQPALQRLRTLAIGQTTAAALREHGAEPGAIADHPDPFHVVEALAKVLP